MLEQLDYSREITPADGRHDKMEIEINHAHRLTTKRERIDNIRRFLSTDYLNKSNIHAPCHSVDFRIDNHLTEGWIYGASNNTRVPYRPPLDVRGTDKKAPRNEEEVLKQPLFIGKMDFSYYCHPNPEAQTTTEIKYVLSLNPTRYIHHYPDLSMEEVEALSVSEERKRYWPQYHFLTARESINEYEGEFTMGSQRNCLSDNWIPKTPLHRAYIRNYRRYLAKERHYIQSVWEALQSEWSRSLDVVEDEVNLVGDVFEEEISEDFSIRLKYIETYFEFTCENPTLIVESLYHHLQDYNSHKVKRDEHEGIENSPVIKMKLSADGAELCIYAKTNRRIRFEVRHRAFYQRGFPDGVLSQSNVMHDMDSLKIRTLREIKENAATHMSRIFAHLHDRANPPRLYESASLSQFIVLFLSAVEDSERCATLLSMLMTTGKIISHPAIRQDIVNLRNVGILENIPSGNRRGNRVKRYYRRALQELTDMENNPYVNARRTRITRVRRRRNPS